MAPVPPALTYTVRTVVCGEGVVESANVTGHVPAPASVGTMLNWLFVPGTCAIETPGLPKPPQIPEAAVAVYGALPPLT